MASRSRSRTLSFCALALGVALFSTAMIAPFLLIPPLKTIPLSAGGRTVTTESTGMLLNSSAFAANLPVDEHKNAPECATENTPLPLSCFIEHAAPLQVTRHVEAIDPSGEKFITLRAGATLQRTDTKEPESVISATVDTVTLNRYSAEPDSDHPSSFHVSAPGLGVEEDTDGFDRSGLQYQFPFDTERRSYQYFDTTAQTDHLIDFADAIQVDNGTGEMTILEFHHNLGAVNLFDVASELLGRDGELTDDDRATLAGTRLTGPAGRWYTEEELEERGLTAEDNVAMNRYYAVVRTIRVEPKTGVIVFGEEYLNYFFARSEEEAQKVAETFFEATDNADTGGYTPSPLRTALLFDAAWDETTQHNQLAKAHDGYARIKRLEFAIYLMGILGSALVVAAALGLRRGKLNNHPE